MNILIIGTGVIEQRLIDLCIKSKHLDHIYTASKAPLEKFPNIEYTDFKDLCNKTKRLQIDITLVADKNLIQNGIVETFRKHYLNIISVNKKWFNLESSRLIAKQLLNYYSINIPKTIKAPLTFPIIIKTDKPESTKIAFSMQELVEIREELTGKEAFLEEFLDGEIYYLLSLWDGKNLVSFKSTKEITEVQADRLDLYKTKLSFMLSDERADFIGFFISKLIWAKNDWHVIEYIMHLNDFFEPDVINKDFLYILNSAIYQKLNEL